jgi:hypothetical protein
MLAVVVGGDDVGMLEAGGRDRLLEESFSQTVVRDAEQLDSNGLRSFGSWAR